MLKENESTNSLTSKFDSRWTVITVVLVLADKKIFLFQLINKKYKYQARLIYYLANWYLFVGREMRCCYKQKRKNIGLWWSDPHCLFDPIVFLYMYSFSHCSIKCVSTSGWYQSRQLIANIFMPLLHFSCVFYRLGKVLNLSYTFVYIDRSFCCSILLILSVFKLLILWQSAQI